MRFVVASMFVLLLVGCTSGESYYRLEEYGEGWQLTITEDGEQFRASWTEGDNRSTKLVNYTSISGTDYYAVNTLYLELDDNGTVVNGRLKRIILPDFEKRDYYEQNAEWFRVLEGRCILDAELEGTLDVRCQGGYEFKGDVQPLEDLKVKRPE